MGAKHLFHMMQLILTQPEEIQDIARRVVQNNAFYAHPENILVAMLEDEDKTIRKEALDKITAVRAKGLVNISAK